MIEGIVFIVVCVVAVFLNVQYNAAQEEKQYNRRKIKSNSANYSKLVNEYKTSVEKGNPIMSPSEFEKKKEEILDSREEKAKIIKQIKEEEEEELEKKEDNKRKRIVGYKYDEFIFKIFNDNHELRWDELLDGVHNTFNLPRLDLEPEDQYNMDIDGIRSPAEEILDIWFENSLIEICSWSRPSEKNPWNRENFKVGGILRYKHHKINDYDITYDVWLEDRKITLKHNKWYDLYMEEKSLNI